VKSIKLLSVTVFLLQASFLFAFRLCTVVEEASGRRRKMRFNPPPELR
jgi:hypothetical protein